MQNPKHSEDSNSDRKSPSSSSPPQQPPPSDDIVHTVNPTEEGSENLKSGVPVATEVGGSMVMEGRVVVSEGRGKKRKASEVKDPPSGTPSCPICYREFLTWKGAFGHMRKHPDRDYRGFFKPPVFESSSTTREPLNKGDGGEISSTAKEMSREKGSASPLQGLVFDLNNPIEEAESSNHTEGRNEAHVSPQEEKIVDEGKNLELDLNKLPDPDENE